MSNKIIEMHDKLEDCFMLHDQQGHQMQIQITRFMEDTHYKDIFTHYFTLA